MSRNKVQIDTDTANELKQAVGLTPDGKEIFDDTPLFVEGLKRPLTIQDRIERIVRLKLSQQAVEQGHESFEESEDFDVPDDAPMPLSGYEVYVMDEIRAMEKARSFPLESGAEGPEATKETNPPEADRSEVRAQPEPEARRK